MTKNKASESEPILQFLRKLRNRSYLAKFMTTLEGNKIESGYQAPMLPMIFLKKIDEYGVVESYEPNPIYGNMIPMPKTNFTVEEADTLLKSCNANKRLKALRVFVTVGHLEHTMLPTLIDWNGNTACPLILKQFDKDGIPIAYALNAKVEVKET